VLECYDKQVIQSDQALETHRKGIIEAILATDMAQHNSGLESFKTNKDKYLDCSFEPGQANVSGDYRKALRGFLVHGADINNPCLDFDIYINWAALLAHEFNHQAALEAEKGLDVLSFMVYTNELGFYKAQTGFSSRLGLTRFRLSADVQSHPGHFS
jgi:hypothetical protein